ncbi:MAG: hypothetical protein LVR00_01725 [Rhabdochlamydiaceae bacterium]|jgi:hypothetical protein
MDVDNAAVKVGADQSVLERGLKKLGLEEVYSILPSSTVTCLALRVLTSYVAVTQYTHIGIGLGAVQILSESSLSKKIRAVFLLTFLGASALTPLIGVPLGNVLLAIIMAYANYKKNPTLFTVAAGAVGAIGVLSIADRVHSLLRGSQGNVGIASTMVSSLLGNVPKRDIEDVSYLDEALSGLQPSQPTISELPEAANGLVPTDKLVQEFLAIRSPISAGTVLANQIKAYKPVLRTVQQVSGATCLIAAALSYEPTLHMVGKGLDALEEATSVGAYVDEQEDPNDQDWINNPGERYLYSRNS